MTLILWLLVLPVAYAGARWAGRTLDRHYSDFLEVVGVLVLFASVLGPMLLASSLLAAPWWIAASRVALLVAIVAGLFAGNAVRRA